MIVDSEDEDEFDDDDEEDDDEETSEAGPSNKRKRADENGLGFLAAGNAGFLTSLDAKDISR
jgi:hypothetical protein